MTAGSKNPATLVRRAMSSITVHNGISSGRDFGSHFDYEWSAATHAGLRRPSNQDSYRIVGPVFVVCDGMGGEQGGAIASSIAAGLIAMAAANGELVDSAFLGTVVDANRAVLAATTANPELVGMGTTAVAIGVCQAENGSQLVGLNVGDSRAYICEESKVTQLSHDHSVVQELLDHGSISSEQAQTHRERSVLTSAIGMEQTPEPFVWSRTPRVGTRYLLCTDGIHRSMRPDVLSQNLAGGPPRHAVNSLVQAAFSSGAVDNLALIVVDVCGEIPEHDADITVDRARDKT